MNIHVKSQKLDKIKAGGMVITVFEKDDLDLNPYKTLDNALGGLLRKLIESGEIKGKYKEFTLIHSGDKIPTDHILVMGLGKKKDFNIDRIRAVMAISARNFRRINVNNIVVPNFNDMGLDMEDEACAIVEGIILGLYRFRKYMTKEDSGSDYLTIKDLTLVTQNSKDIPKIRKGITKGEILSYASNLAKDLINEPSSNMTPTIFSEKAKEISKECGLKIKILDKKDIQKLNMGAFLAVAKGSEEPPKLVVLEYKGGDKNSKTIGLVGKGITFDSGGLNLKPGESMFRMFCDMAGAGAVLCTMKAIAQQKLKINVVGVIPLAENIPDGRSYKPGDIIKSMSGKTIEILNTDAEGRLLLVDALTYIKENYKPDMIFDIATLTGAIVIALGRFASGIMGNDQELIEKMRIAGERSGERVWQLPLFEEYKAQLRSDVADIENSGGRDAGSITAAWFLREFVGDTPWVHIDIAGTAVMEETIMPYLKSPYLPKEGATGVGTRLLYYMIESLSLS